MSVLKQISIPDHDTWTIDHANKLAAKKQLSPTTIRAWIFYDKYQHILEADGTLPGLIDMIKELQSQVQDLSSKVENMKYVTSDNQDGDGPEVDGDDILNMLEEME